MNPFDTLEARIEALEEMVAIAAQTIGHINSTIAKLVARACEEMNPAADEGEKAVERNQ